MTDLSRTADTSGGHSDRITLCGCAVDLMELGPAVAAIASFDRTDPAPPLAVASVNLDHLTHFGGGSRWHGVLEESQARGRMRWLSLVDGAPIATRAEQVTGRHWPRLAGSDLTAPVLDALQAAGASVGFLGGSEATHERLRATLARTRPALRVAGTWAPTREVVSDPVASRALAAEIRASGTDVLLVGLGKPRQELWIAEHGHLTGARRLLAFGAVVDFLAGDVPRAPAWMAEHGLEWSYRLAKEPRRLARRYVVDGPLAYARLHRTAGSATDPAQAGATAPGPTFVPPDAAADVTVVVVTHDSAAVVEPLLGDLRREVGPLRLRVVVVDNRSSDDTLDRVARHPDVVMEAAPNDGYAAGVNRGVRLAGDSRAVLVLNPDVRLEEGALLALWERLWRPGVGAVVPALLDDDGRVTRSLRFEPRLLRTLGDAVLGDHLPQRPTWATETDRDAESYAHPHAVEWATGAAVLVRTDVLADVGEWDESYFLYSEEVDFLRRVREAGSSTWFEPAARLRHTGGGSGGPAAELAALLAVNRVRYLEGLHGRAYGAGVRAAAALGEALRAGSGDHRRSLGYLLSRGRWDQLPGPESRAAASVGPGLLAPPCRGRSPEGSVVVPAHDEAAVIARALAPLASLAAGGEVEVVVAANGCRDTTVERARQVEDVVVLDLARPSKTAALNAADAVATRWPRLYVDADVEITPRAVADVLATLAEQAGPGASPVLAARPPFVYDCARASRWVRAYYAARGRLPEAHAHLWGAGVYGVSRVGHERFGRFPSVVADDLFVDGVFAPDERAVVDTDPVVVHTPRDLRSLVVTLRRSGAGNRALARRADLLRRDDAPGAASTVRHLLTTVRSPRHLAEAAVYAGVALAARVPARVPARAPGEASTAAPAWGRDDSSRAAAQAPGRDRRRASDRSPTAIPAASTTPTTPIPSIERVVLPTTRVV
ncbi:WecB/TagA/CpsF family glycosyltransferase [Nocardioides zeae]|uniref:WecB/TagA/CpsF family glycosyltransferase n=1 Tax=Nocardioides imazamoxiresistens TaxID=3231893 RepID=A0ABU3PTK8_9ACTN|nr:WecB/TagA/CpsF family glycosyltransferase [Nocardioides zeae]MDT9592543.1 WecB/TagA/CpsF family glycosyltransferase [Nocardioides zeae]